MNGTPAKQMRRYACAPAAASRGVETRRTIGTTRHKSSAVSAIAPADLGVRLVQAGGDLACVNDPAFTQPILEGLRARTRDDAAFAERVTQSARRVVALKLALGLAG